MFCGRVCILDGGNRDGGGGIMTIESQAIVDILTTVDAEPKRYVAVSVDVIRAIFRERKCRR